MFFNDRVALAQEVRGPDFPDYSGFQRTYLFELAGSIFVVLQLVIGEALLVEPPGGLVSSQLGLSKLGRPGVDLVPLSLSEVNVADCGQRGCLVGRVLEAGLFLDEVVARLIFLATSQEALSLHQDNSVPAHFFREIGF